MKKSTKIQNGRRKPAILRNQANGLTRVVEHSKAKAKAGFFAKIKKGGVNDCWEWTASKASSIAGQNYGNTWLNGKKWKAHRLAWVFAFGPIPKGKLVMHTCDNPPCCNPKHLAVGTTKENSDDCHRKGRAHHEQGEDRYNAVLNDEKVAEIRLRYKFRDPENGGVALAREYGVGQTMISAIIRRHRWKHVP